MRINSISFVRSIGNTSQIGDIIGAPKGEIAVVGRSNVGKSSLINFMVGQSVARTSRTPGRTRLINLFLINEEFYLVDFPGYGYAAGNEKEHRTWAPLIESYVQARDEIKGFFLLMDSRHFPLPADAEAAGWIDRLGIPFVIVLTKTDKLNQRDRAALLRAMKIFMIEHPNARGPVYSSVHANKGKPELLHAMQELIS